MKKYRSFRRWIVCTLGKIIFIIVAATILLTALLRWVPPPTSAFMLQRHFEARREGWRDFRLHYKWVGREEISPFVAIAVVAAEDQKFPTHYGLDFAAISDALQENRTRALPRGASTISQQVSKNLFLWPGRSLIRKGLEAYFTILIETLWPKGRILEVYLNIAEFGSGVFGVQAASETFFHKPPARLEPAEAALLAAVLPNPLRFKVSHPSTYLKTRGHQIRKQMELLGGPAYLKELWNEG